MLLLGFVELLLFVRLSSFSGSCNSTMESYVRLWFRIKCELCISAVEAVSQKLAACYDVVYDFCRNRMSECVVLCYSQVFYVPPKSLFSFRSDFIYSESKLFRFHFSQVWIIFTLFFGVLTTYRFLLCFEREI